jgi:peptidoglycan/LPS O-acetylase OafA/YrhL
VETILAALILGPLVTEFSIGRYFADRQFWHYPLNIVGDIHYTLPGVFLHNPTPRIVNLQLWTIPGELLCYLAIVVVSVIGLIRIRVAIPVVAIGYAVILTLSLFMSAHNHSAGLPLFAGVSLNTLLISFLAGVAIFLYRDLLPLNFPIFIGCSVASYALLWNGTYQYAASFPVAYCTVFLGLTDFRKTFVTATGDYSYGVYLYGYPVQQTVMYAFPTLNNTWFNFGTSLAVALLFASLSWHLVESQVLARRRTIIASVQTQFDRLSLATRRITQPR